VLHKTMPMPSEKIKLRILMQPDEVTHSTPPIQPPQPIPKTLEPTPAPKAIEPRIITPRIITENRPILQSIPRTIPAAVPIPVTKTPDVIPVATPKTPPPTPVKEEYKYPHKNEFDSIFRNGLKCTNKLFRFNKEGNLEIIFSLTSEGEIENLKIHHSSGDEILDQEVLKQIPSLAKRVPRPKETIEIAPIPIRMSCKSS